MTLMRSCRHSKTPLAVAHRELRVTMAAGVSSSGVARVTALVVDHHIILAVAVSHGILGETTSRGWS